MGEGTWFLHTLANLIFSPAALMPGRKWQPKIPVGLLGAGTGGECAVTH